MNKINIQKAVRKTPSKNLEIKNDKVFITENGKTRMELILNVGPTGIYTSDDNFYGWEKF